MGNLLSYSGITTKIRAMQSNLITEAEFRELAVLSSVSEYVVFLKKHPAYSQLFLDIDENRIHRGQIEKLLTLSLYNDFTKIYRFSNPEQRKFLKLYFTRYEVAILKACMHAVLNGNTDLPNKDMIKSFFEHYSSIDTNKLFAAQRIEDFISALKGTDYYKPLSKLAEIKNPTLFDYEMTLDLYFFKKLWKLSPKLIKSKELDSILSYYGSKIDMLNIQWIYRSKKYYDMTSADIYALLIPTSYKLKKQDTMRLVEAASIDEFEAVLKTTYYAKYYDGNNISAEFLEDLYLKVLDKINYSNGRKSPYSVAIINTYLYRKEHEIDKLTTVLECIRYGLDSNETLNYIIK